MVSKKFALAVAVLLTLSICSGLFAQQVFDGTTAGSETSTQTSTTSLSANWKNFGSATTTYSVWAGNNMYSASIASFSTYANTSSSASFSGLSLSLGSTYYTTVAGITASRSIVAIAVGGAHSVALYSDGTVWTWGFNNFGALGNNSTTNSSTPVQVEGVGGSGFLTGIVAIAGGDEHTVALKNDGTVWDWGDNSQGELGDTTTIQRNTPAQVATGAGVYLSGITAIACGYLHTIALRNDGTVWTWGYNAESQLGNNSTTNSSTPVQVEGVGGSGFLTGIVAIAGAEYHTAALKNDGTVWAWGFNGQGQLGNNSTTQSTTPVQVKGVGGSGFLTGIVAIACGYNHTIALKNDGTVWAWGLNNFGQLGNNSTTNSSTPVQVSGLAGIVAVAGGEYHTIALGNDGTVWTWGDNGNGQLGDTTTIQRNTPVQVATGAGVYLSGIIAIASNNTALYTVSLRNDGTVWTWGYNNFGQLGNNSTTQSTTPVQPVGMNIATAVIVSSSGVTIVPPPQVFDGIVAGSETSTQTSTTTINSNWQGFGAAATTYHVGVGFTPYSTNTVAYATYANTLSSASFSGLSLNLGSTYYTTVEGINNVAITSIAAGGNHSVALYSDGTVWVWGLNSDGQLGDGSTTQRNSPVQVSGLTGIIAIASGYKHTVALKNDGTVWAWGFNNDGELGDTTTIGRNTPVQVATAANTYLTGIVAISSGSYHTMALKNDGTVWTWGYNAFGELGNNSTTNSSTPVQVEGVGGSGFLTGIVAMAGGSYHTIVLKNDGTVWACGENNNGRLGDTTTIQRNTPVQVATAANTYLSGIVAIADGGSYTTALKNDGTVWTWGANSKGQLGDTTTIDRSTPVQVATAANTYLSGIIAIADGDIHTTALKNDGTVWTWGDNASDELGDTTTIQRNTPVQVATAANTYLSGIVAISTRGAALHTIALKNNGTVWDWGFNSNGQLGNGTTTNSSTAVQVTTFVGTLSIATSSGVKVVVPPDASPDTDLTGGSVSVPNTNGYVTSSSAVTVNWANFADTGDGINSYNVGIVTSNTPSGTLVANGGLAAYPNTASSAAFSFLTLTNGTTYFAEVIGQDVTGNAVTVYSSGFIVDAAGPTMGTLVSNGTSSSSFQTSTSTISVSWSGFSDSIDGMLTGANTYRVGVGTSPGASNIVALTNYANTASSATFSGLTLTSGTPYYITINAYDVAGNVTTVNSASITPDAAGPTGGNIYFTNGTPGTNMIYQASANALSLYWAGFGDSLDGMLVGANTYRIGIGSTPGATDVVALTNYANTTSTATFTGLALTAGNIPYYATIVASDAVGNTATVNSSAIYVNSQLSAQVNDGTGADIAFQSSTTNLSGNWVYFSNLLSGITSYSVGIVTVPVTGSYIVPLTAYPNTTSSATFTGLSLTAGSEYYVQVTATNGTNSATLYSNGVGINATLNNASVVSTTGNVINITNANSQALIGNSPLPSGVTNFVYGMFDFKITGLSPGASANVTITLPNALTTGSYVWYWYNSNTGVFSAVPAADISNPSGDNQTFVMTLTDGGFGDLDGVANGVIVDPIGPGTLSGSGGSSSGGGGLSFGGGGGGSTCGTTGLDAMLALALVYYLRRRMLRVG